MQGRSTGRKVTTHIMAFVITTGLERARKGKELLPNEAQLYVNHGAVIAEPRVFMKRKTNFRRAVELDPRKFIVLMEAGSPFRVAPIRGSAATVRASLERPA